MKYKYGKMLYKRMCNPKTNKLHKIIGKYYGGF